MTDVELKTSLLKKYLPFESEIVGDVMVMAIASGSEPEMPAKGESFDVLPVFEVLAAISTVIANLITIYLLLRSEQKSSITLKEFLEMTRDQELPKTLQGSREELIDDVLNELRRRNQN